MAAMEQHGLAGPGGAPSAAQVQSHLLAALMSNTSDNIYFKDEQCRFTLISRSMAKLFGIQSPAEATGRTDFDFFTEEHARKAYEDEQAVMRTGVPLINREEKETWPDGHTTWVTSTKMPLIDADGRVIGTFGISRDITEKKLAEEELQRHRDHLEELVEERTRELRVTNEHLQREMTERERAEKALLEGVRIAAIRSMAGGVAIAFNNVLGIISAYAASIAANFIPKTRVHEEASRILDATKRAAALTQRLLSMAQAGEPKARVTYSAVPLARVIQEATDFVGDMFRDRNVAIHLAKLEGMPAVIGDRSQLVDALLTFLVNAGEAMPEGGTVRIDAVERKVARPPVKGGVPAGEYAVLRIRDTGVGMSKDIRRRIFDPFFTTKKNETSFGLGLYIAQSAIHGMGGWIRVSSRPGKGASFRIYLPKAERVEPEPVAKPATARREHLTVLVVDDEPDTLHMMTEALKHAGFKVYAADSPQAGLSAYGRHAAEIDLSVIDGVMQDGGTARLVRRIRRAQPQACLLITSGFSRDYVRGVLPMGPWGFIQKPFEGESFIRAIQETVARYGASAD